MWEHLTHRLTVSDQMLLKQLSLLVKTSRSLVVEITFAMNKGQRQMLNDWR